MIFIKIILGACLLFVFLQDIKERFVYWFLFPIIGALGGILFYQNTLPELFYMSLKFNIFFVLIFILIIFLYAKYKLKTPILETIGLGDFLLFFAISLSFSSLAFIIMFISALIFSLILHLTLSKNKNSVTVPLAGYMSVFFLGIYLVNWLGYSNLLYTI